MQLHSHCQSGLAPEVYERRCKAAFSYAHTAVEPLANGASLPATEDIAARAAALGFDTSHRTMDALAEVSGYFDWLVRARRKPRGHVASYDPALYEHRCRAG